MQEYTMRDYPIWGRLQGRAPGLTADTIDRLMRDSWAQGFEAGATEVRPEVERERKESLSYRQHVAHVISSRLNHIARHLEEGRKSKRQTIKGEREWSERQAAALREAIRELDMG